MWAKPQSRAWLPSHRPACVPAWGAGGRPWEAQGYPSQIKVCKVAHVVPPWLETTHMAAPNRQGRQERSLHTSLSLNTLTKRRAPHSVVNPSVLIPHRASRAEFCALASAGTEVKSLPINFTFYLENRHGSACLKATPVSGGFGIEDTMGALSGKSCHVRFPRLSLKPLNAPLGEPRNKFASIPGSQ